MKPKFTLLRFFALAGSSVLAISSASAQSTYTWANSNVSGTPTANLDWFTGGTNTQGTWIGGDPVSSNLNTIQFFENTTTALPNTANPSTQNVNLNNGGTAFQLGTLTLSGRGSATTNANLTMNLSGDALNFSAATGTVNLDAVNNTRTITYNVANNIQLGTASSATALTFTGNGTSTFNFTGNISELQTGGGSLVKSGSSTLILSGTNNTYSGTTTISAGTLEGRKNTTGGASPFGASTIQLNAGTLRSMTTSATDTAETFTFGNNVNVGGDATINFTRVGGVGSTKTHAYGNLSIGSNTLSLTASNINHTLSFTGATLTGNAIINNGTSATTNIGAITETGGPRNLTKQGVATLRLTGTNTYTGTTSISGGTLEVQGSIASSSGITNNATLTFNSSSDQSYGNVISGSGALTKTGTGTLTLSGDNTFTGNVTVGGSGTLVLSGINSYTGTTNIGGGSSSGPGTLSVNSVSDYGVASAIGAASSGAINFNANANNTSRFIYTGTGGSMNRQFSIGFSGDGTVRNGGINNDGSGALILTASTFNVAIAGTTATRTLTLGGTYTGSANEIQGVIQNNATGGAINLTKSGSGTWKLSGANTYTGVTSVGANGGILQFGKVNSLYNGNTASWTAANIRVANGGTLAFNVGGTGEFTSSDVGTLFTNLANSTNATTNGMAAGSRFGFDTTNASGGSFEISQVVADSGGTSGGARGLTKLGTGTLVLSNTNTYSGGTTVSAGTLYVTGALTNSSVTVQANGTVGSNGSAGSLGNGLTIETGGDLDLTDGTLGLNSTGILSLTGGSLTLGNLTFQDLVGWNWASAAEGTYQLIDGTFDINWGSTAYLSEETAYDFGNGRKGYFTSGSLNAVIVAVPEPRAALLGGLGLLMLLRRRR